MINPLEQFNIKTLWSVTVESYDIVFTNCSLFILIAYICLFLFFRLNSSTKALIPTRLQVSAEAIYQIADQMLLSTCGRRSKRFLPLIFTLFIFILTANLIGMVPGSFSITSHIVVTFTLAIIVFSTATILGFVKHGFSYLSLFLPKGIPIAIAPLIIVIELFAYLARPVSLSIRLAANMAAGHIILKVLAAFTIMSGIFGFLPFALLTILIGFEIFVAILQAYIFSVLSCVYLNDALNLH